MARKVRKGRGRFWYVDVTEPVDDGMVYFGGMLMTPEDAHNHAANNMWYFDRMSLEDRRKDYYEGDDAYWLEREKDK